MAQKKKVTFGANRTRWYTPTAPRDVIRNGPTGLKRQNAMSKLKAQRVARLVQRLNRNREENKFLRARLKAIRGY